MPEDNTTTGAGQAPAAGQPQAGGTAPQAGDETTGTGAAGTRSLAELEAELARVRREAAGHRARATQLEKAQADADAAKLSDLEKAQRERDTYKAQIEADRLDRQATINRYEVKLKAAALGIVDPDAAALLLDWESVEYAEDGSPKNVEAALKALLRAKPYLAGQAAQSSGAPMNPASGRGAATLTLADVKKMSPTQINERWADVQKALAGG